MNMSYPHHPDEARITTECAELVSESLTTGIPLILEALPFGTDEACVRRNGVADAMDTALELLRELARQCAHQLRAKLADLLR